jgi:ribosomal protein S18 acetylase RimI-like enzyme
MAAITIPFLAETPQLRPLNILRDLPRVADLIEKCFASTMDSEGRSYLQQMRRAGQDNTFLHWASSAVETASMPLSGYVWEEKGEIIGNVSLIPHRYKHQRIYLIANVAVHPDHRRRGIGRYLTFAAMTHARQHHGSETWLHVRDDNPGAIALYLGLGFEEIARRTAWQARPERNVGLIDGGRKFGRRSSRDWLFQEAWLQRIYPELLNWYQPMPWTSLKPDFSAALYRFMMDYNVRHWASHSNGQVTAVLSWQALSSQNDRIWAAVPPQGSEMILTELLLRARRELTWRQGLTLDFPEGEYSNSIQQAGFTIQRTLLWMKLNQQKSVDHP